jgi:hypothetical protein
LVASSAPGRTRRRASTQTTSERRKSIGGWYGVPGHGANPSFRAPQAAALLLEALEIAAELDSRYLLPGLLASLAVVAGERGDLERAARLLGASQVSYEAAGVVPDPVDAHDPDRMRAAARDRLGADRFARLWEEGRHLSLDWAVAQARSVAG